MWLVTHEPFIFYKKKCLKSHKKKEKMAKKCSKVQKSARKDNFMVTALQSAHPDMWYVTHDNNKKSIKFPTMQKSFKNEEFHSIGATIRTGEIVGVSRKRDFFFC